jgi:heme A synthase
VGLPWLSISGFLAAGTLGTFAALGDALSASTSFAESLHADFSAFSNIFVRLRILHPLVAGALGFWLLFLAIRVFVSGSARAKRISATIAGLVLCQFALGITNILMGTPPWLQLFHLLGADLLWITSVIAFQQTPQTVSLFGCRPYI